MIFFVLFLVILAIVLQWKMAGRALDYLSCSIRSEDYLAEPGGEFTLVFTVKNHSRLPVLFLRCRCSVPVDAVLSGEDRGKITVLFHTAQYTFSCFLMPHQCVEHRFSLRLPKRGAYEFSDLRLAAGDFFGLKETEAKFPGSCEVVVLPPEPEQGKKQQVSGGLMGERSVLRWIHEDPILSSGFREYTGREPLKTVSWNRSLQSGKLMVRNMDHTTEEKVTDLFSMDEGLTEDVEHSLSVCRELCEALEQQKLPFAFMHNGMLMTTVGVLPPVETGLGRQHLNRILESLGRAVPQPRETLKTLISRTQLRAQDSSCYLLLVPAITRSVRQAASRLESASGSMVRIICGGVPK